MTDERVGEAFELDARLTVLGRQLASGDRAPEFALDTPVCHVETKRWDEEKGRLPDSAQLYTISMDLPFAQARWQGAEGVGHVALSGHRDESFGRGYGVLIKEPAQLHATLGGFA